MVGASKAMEEVFSQVRRAVTERRTLWVEGETGTGKERLARAVHTLSGAPEASYQVWDGHRASPPHPATTGPGTLLLDEVGALPLDLQHSLAERLPMARKAGDALHIVTTSQRPLQALLAEGKLLPRLARLLAEVALVLPPLRERGGELAVLAQDIVEEARLELCQLPDLLAALRWHPFPGNVRELKNLLIRAACMPSLDPEWLGLSSPAPRTSQENRTYAHARQEALREFESGYFGQLLSDPVLDRKGAEERTGLSTPSLYRLLKKNSLRLKRLKNYAEPATRAPSST